MVFTNNYVKYQNYMFVSSQDNYDFQATASDGVSKWFAGDTAYMNSIGTWMAKAKCTTIGTDTVALPTQSKMLSNGTYGGIWFGSGSTPAAKTDYALEAPITSGLSITNPPSLVSYTDPNGDYAMISTFTVKNTTSDDVTVGEVGLFLPGCRATSPSINSSNAFWSNFLMERTVLPEPITIPAGQIKIISYKMTFNKETM